MKLHACIIMITVLALASLPAITALAQTVDEPSMPTSGFHSLSLQRTDAPEIHYSILIPRGYSPSKAVPLILALHFAVPAGNAAGAGRDLIQILIAPALVELGAIIVAPDSVRGDWSSPENARLQATAWAASEPGILGRNSRNGSAR